MDLTSSGAGERHHVDVGVAGELSSHAEAITIDHVEHAWREARFVDHLGEQGRAQWGDLTWLEDHGATHTKSGNHLERDLVHWPVPRSDESGDTDRFVQNLVVGSLVAKWTLKLKCLKRLNDALDMTCPRTNLRAARRNDDQK